MPRVKVRFEEFFDSGSCTDVTHTSVLELFDSSLCESAVNGLWSRGVVGVRR